MTQSFLAFFATLNQYTSALKSFIFSGFSVTDLTLRLCPTGGLKPRLVYWPFSLVPQPPTSLLRRGRGVGVIGMAGGQRTTTISALTPASSPASCMSLHRWAKMTSIICLFTCSCWEKQQLGRDYIYYDNRPEHLLSPAMTRRNVSAVERLRLPGSSSY